LRPGDAITIAPSLSPAPGGTLVTSSPTAFVIGQFDLLLSTLVNYLDDLPVPDEFEAAMAAESLSLEAQTVLDTGSRCAGARRACGTP
jgi:hypothetical protein